VADGHGEDRIDESDGRPQEPVTPIALPDAKQPHSNFTDDPLARLWQDADDRQTGAEAIEAIRARQKASDQASKDGRRRRGRRET